MGGNVLISSPSESANPAFSVPDTSNNTLRTGTAVARVGNSPGAAAANVASAGTAINARSENNNASYTVTTRDTGRRGPIGATSSNPRAIISSTPSESLGSLGGGGSSRGPAGADSLGSGLARGSNTRGSREGVSTRGGGSVGSAAQTGGNVSARTGGSSEGIAESGSGVGTRRGPASSGSGPRGLLASSGNGVSGIGSDKPSGGGPKGSVNGISGGVDGGNGSRGTAKARVNGNAGNGATTAGDGASAREGSDSGGDVAGNGSGKGKGGVRNTESETAKASGSTRTTRNASLNSRVEPETPDSWRGKTFDHYIKVEVTVLPSGRTQASITDGSGVPELDSAVLAAVRRWRYSPAVRDGQPVESTQNVTVHFVRK